MLELESRKFQNKNTFFLAHQDDRVSLALRVKFVNQSGHKTDINWPGYNGLVLCFGASPLYNTGTNPSVGSLVVHPSTVPSPKLEGNLELCCNKKNYVVAEYSEWKIKNRGP